MKIQPINLTEAQIQMLSMSDKDIETNSMISQGELDKQDLEWLLEFVVSLSPNISSWKNRR
jgi:hypothetical protein